MCRVITRGDLLAHVCYMYNTIQILIGPAFQMFRPLLQIENGPIRIRNTPMH